MYNRHKKSFIIFGIIIIVLISISVILFNTDNIIQRSIQRKNIEEAHIVCLTHGIGNQMFQYAFGKALEAKTGRKVFFDKEDFNPNPNDYGRKYELNIFNVKTDSATRENTRNKKSINERGVYEFYYMYHPEFFDSKEPSYYTGYFQNEKYFKDIKKKIKKDFTFPKISKDDKFNQYWIKKIKESKNPVFIHIRRNDYIENGWELPIDYYKKAVQYIIENVEDPQFFVFGIKIDDFLKEEFDIGVPYEYIGETNHINNEDWKDIMLMSHFKHAIIANSSFSWWGAWLGPEQKGGIIVAPSPFLFGKDDIVCDDWVKIHYLEEK